MTRRPRKLLVTMDAVGGVWRYALDLSRGLRERGVEPVLAVLGPAPSRSQADEADSAGLSLIHTGLPLDWTATDAASVSHAQDALEHLTAELGCDGAHLHTPAFAPARRWRVPCVAVSHSCVATWWSAVRGGELPDDFQWRTGLVTAGLANADAVIAPTRAHADAVAAAYDVDRPQVVHNGRRTRHLTAARVRQRHLLAVGRLWDEAKGVSGLDGFASRSGVAVRAAGPLQGPNGVGVRLACVQHLGTLGEQALQEEYAACGAFVSLARYEPFGLAVLEAAQAAAPLILSDIPTFRELWDGAALFVLPGDDQGLARAVDSAFGDPSWGGKAQERARRYTLEATVERTLAIHQATAAARATQAMPA